MRRAAKKDARHAEMVADLRKMGFSVIDLSRVGDSCPDLLVGRQRLDLIAEVKTRLTKHKIVSPTQYLTDGQRDLHARWRGSPIFAAFTAEEIAREHTVRARAHKEWRRAAVGAAAAAMAANARQDIPSRQARICRLCGQLRAS
jgi:hypothetical protein